MLWTVPTIVSTVVGIVTLEHYAAVWAMLGKDYVDRFDDRMSRFAPWHWWVVYGCRNMIRLCNLEDYDSLCCFSRCWISIAHSRLEGEHLAYMYSLLVCLTYITDDLNRQYLLMAWYGQMLQGRFAFQWIVVDFGRPNSDYQRLLLPLSLLRLCAMVYSMSRALFVRSPWWVEIGMVLPITM